MSSLPHNANDFAAIVRAIPDAAVSRSVGLEVLNEFCKGIEDGTQGAVRCRLERGYATNIGQQWCVMVHGEAQQLDQVLLRAYIPAQSPPVATLDVYDEAPIECHDKADLEAALRRFLQQEATQSNIRLLAMHP